MLSRLSRVHMLEGGAGGGGGESEHSLPGGVGVSWVEEEEGEGGSQWTPAGR